MIKVKNIFVISTIYILVFSSCALNPLAYQPEKIPAFEGTTKLNDKLVNSDKIQLNGWFGPEDILFDNNG